MRFFGIAVLVGILFVGCASTSVVSKSTMGNLEIYVLTTEGRQLNNAEIYLDGGFIGNQTGRLPVIYAKRGERLIRVECPGFKPYEKKVMILGDPNHQVLNIVLEKL